MHDTIDIVTTDVFPLLAETPEPPKQLYYRGSLPSPDTILLAVVGSRRYTNYGKQCVQHLLSGLRGYDICIVSGLALGIDALAHIAAMDAGLTTIAIPGSGIDDRVLYPSANRGLARKILENRGSLISEFEPTFQATPWSFPARNRIIAGISHATLVIEAGPKSGTLITARLATEYNRNLLVVPGSIFSENSKGVHQFMRLGATPVTSPDDILQALGLDAASRVKTETLFPSKGPEAKVLTLLCEPTSRDTLIRTLAMDTATANILLMQMELAGHIIEEQGIIRRG